MLFDVFYKTFLDNFVNKINLFYDKNIWNTKNGLEKNSLFSKNKLNRKFFLPSKIGEKYRKITSKVKNFLKNA